MKRVKYLLLILLISLFCIPNAYALSCNNADSNDLVSYASFVKAKYDVVNNSKRKKAVVNGREKPFIVPNFVFNISVFNITDSIYISIKNDINNEEIKVYSKDTKDGRYTFSNYDFGTIYKYTITVNSNNPACLGEKIRAINIIKPKYNPYSEIDECDGSSLIYCQRFLSTNKEIDLNEFTEMVELEQNDEQKESRLLMILSKHKVAIVLSILLIAIAVLLISIIIVINKIRKRKGEWEI